MENEIEVLAPAGNIDCFVAAVNAGADAIYMGINKFNARTMATNFTLEEYVNCIHEAHKRDVKIYLTLNTLFKDVELKEALDIVGRLYAEGLDAVILQDLGLAIAVHEKFPKLAMHASTQMSVYSKEQVKVLEDVGFTRVVLARELSVVEIEEICKSTSLEIEVFVHGALCVCVSGQCNMSKLIGSRSANRGSCAQPCRMRYTLHLEKSGELITSKYILSKKDIFGIDSVKALIAAGVKSLKIEGRNRTPEYVAQATSMYKKSIQGQITKADEKNLLQMFNRSGKSEGYLQGVRFKNSISIDTPKNTGLVLGRVLAQNKEFIKIKLQEKINLHDGIEICAPNVISTIVTCIKDEHFNISNKESFEGQYVWLGDIKGKCEVGDVVYKTSDSSLNRFIQDTYLQKLRKRRKLDIEICIKKEQPITFKVWGKQEKIVQYVSDIIPEISIKKELEIQDIKNAFSKTEDTFVEFNFKKIELDKGLFLPISKLNELRRNVIVKINDYYIEIDKSNANYINDKFDLQNKKNTIKNSNFKKKETLFIYSYNKLKDYIDEYYKKYGKKLQRIYINAKDFILYEKEIMANFSGLEIFFVIPNVTFTAMHTYITKNLERLVKLGISGILVGSLQYLELLKKLKAQYDIIIGADYSLNISNSVTAYFLEKSLFDFVTLSFELDENEMEKMIKENSVELVENLASAMTSRYCILGSFVGNKEKGICTKPCKTGSYYITDEFSKRYDIICNDYDCTMSLIRNKDRYSDTIRQKVNIRRVWLS